MQHMVEDLVRPFEKVASAIPVAVPLTVKSLRGILGLHAAKLVVTVFIVALDQWRPSQLLEAKAAQTWRR